MSTDEREPSVLDSIEQAETPFEAAKVADAAGAVMLRRIMGLPVEIGRTIVDIVRKADIGDMLSSSANHQ